MLDKVLVGAAMAKITFRQDQKREALVKLREGHKAREVSREYGVSVRTLYRWRVSMLREPNLEEESRKLRSLAVEHRQLQQRFAELALDYSTLRAALMKDVTGDC